MPEKNNNQIEISSGSVIKVLAIISVVLALYFLRDLVLILLTSIVVASFMEAASVKVGRGMLEIFKLRLGRSFLVIFTYFIAIAFCSFLMYLFIPLIVNETSNFVSFVSAYLPQSDFLRTLNGETLSGAGGIADVFSHQSSIDDLLKNAQSFVANLSGGFLQATSTIFGNILNLILIVVISFYLTMQEKGIENFLRIIIPDRYENYAVSLWERTERKIALWVKGQLLLGILCGVLIYLGLALFQVEYALLIAALSAVLELIPFGLMLSSIVAVMFAYSGGDAATAAVVFLFYMIVQLFESYLLQPVVVEKVVGVSPLVVILSVLIGAKLAGFWGIVLAIPAAVLALEYLGDIKKQKISARAV